MSGYIQLSITLKKSTVEKLDSVRKTPNGEIGRSTIIESLLEKTLKGGSKQQ